MVDKPKKKKGSLCFVNDLSNLQKSPSGYYTHAQMTTGSPPAPEVSGFVCLAYCYLSLTLWCARPCFLPENKCLETEFWGEGIPTRSVNTAGSIRNVCIMTRHQHTSLPTFSPWCLGYIHLITEKPTFSPRIPALGGFSAGALPIYRLLHSVIALCLHVFRNVCYAQNASIFFSAFWTDIHKGVCGFSLGKTLTRFRAIRLLFPL